MRRLPSLLVVLCLVGVTGCISYRPGPLSAVEPTSAAPRAGAVYLVRGLHGSLSTGLDALCARLEVCGVRATVYDDVQTDDLAETIIRRFGGQRDPEPIVLVGHSLGADDAVDIARQLDAAGLKVDLLLTLDPLMPDAVPPNVQRAINYYRDIGVMGLLPIFRGVPLRAQENAGLLSNIDLRYDRSDLMEQDVNHFSIDKDPGLHRRLIEHILMACPPRGQWVARHAPAIPDDPETPVAHGPHHPIAED